MSRLISEYNLLNSAWAASGSSFTDIPERDDVQLSAVVSDRAKLEKEKEITMTRNKFKILICASVFISISPH
jgi:hypothetical protein